jgi:hypothetical protein
MGIMVVRRLPLLYRDLPLESTVTAALYTERSIQFCFRLAVNLAWTWDSTLHKARKALAMGAISGNMNPWNDRFPNKAEPHI